MQNFPWLSCAFWLAPSRQLHLFSSFSVLDFSVATAACKVKRTYRKSVAQIDQTPQLGLPEIFAFLFKKCYDFMTS
jgi:hypothetical protein